MISSDICDTKTRTYSTTEQYIITGTGKYLSFRFLVDFTYLRLYNTLIFIIFEKNRLSFRIFYIVFFRLIINSHI